MFMAFKTLIFWLSFMLSGVFFQVALLFRLTGIRDATARHQLAQRYRLIWSAIILRLYFGTKSLTNLKKQSENLPQQFILVANHRSNLDPLLVFVIGRPLVILSKKAVLKTPVIGWWMRLCGDVVVDRGEKASREQSINAMRERLERGDSLLIFPEGTRQTDPQTPLGQFKDGAFALASQTGIPLVTLVLHRTDYIWQKDSIFLNFPGLRFLVSDVIVSANRTTLELKEQSFHIMSKMFQSLTDNSKIIE